MKWEAANRAISAPVGGNDEGEQGRCLDEPEDRLYEAVSCRGQATGGGRRLPFLFVLFFFRWAKPGRRPQCLAMVVERQIAHVQRERAARRLLVDDDGDRTPFDAFAKSDAAAASEPGVGEPFQHPGFIIAVRHGLRRASRGGAQSGVTRQVPVGCRPGGAQARALTRARRFPVRTRLSR